MTRKRFAFGLGALALVAFTTLLVITLQPHRAMPQTSLGNQFDPISLPETFTRELFDIGVADINGDDHLDIFSSNHNTRQFLWISEAAGGYRDMLSEWRFDQLPELPGSEISDRVPEISEPGLYIYWQGRNSASRFPLVIRTHRLNEVGALTGTLSSYSGVSATQPGVFDLEQISSVTADTDEMPVHTLKFSSFRDGTLDVIVVSPGLPLTVQIDSSFPLDKVYVGAAKVHPKANRFELGLQDRHGFAWANLNMDGRLDAYISRGAVGGTIRKFPPAVQAKIQDELMLSGSNGRYANVLNETGIEKAGCSARKVNWVDFDNDGRLDLFINCMERGFVAGEYPKHLYRQMADGKFTDAAAAVGLSLTDREVIEFVWLDVDNDGFQDLVTHEATGFYLYRNSAGRQFNETFLGRGEFARADHPELKGTSNEYWFVDGKLTVADIDGDGFLDIFVASKRGNHLLLNDGKGGFSLVSPSSRGLPAASVTALWVDFDNDGLVDLFAVPQGLFRQRADHTFESTGLLALPEGKYMAAIANWADLDNDGKRELLLALLENFSHWNWWEQRRKTVADKFTWNIEAYRNKATTNNWLQMRLVGPPGNPQGIGARVVAQTTTGLQTQVVGLNDGAFFSQGHYRLYFGLGKADRLEAALVRWPDGRVQELHDLAANQLHVIKHPSAEKEKAIQ